MFAPTGGRANGSPQNPTEEVRKPTSRTNGWTDIISSLDSCTVFWLQLLNALDRTRFQNRNSEDADSLENQRYIISYRWAEKILITADSQESLHLHYSD